MDAVAESWWAWLLLLVGAFGMYGFAIVRYVRAAVRAATPAPAAPAGPPASVLESKILTLQEQVTRLSAEVERLKTAQQGGSPYSQAIAMARRGVSVGEIAASCGISRGEAELIVALHRASLH